MEEAVPEQTGLRSGTKEEGAEYAIRVSVRVRPLLPKEQEENPKECVSVFREEHQIAVGSNCFTFDHVFAGSTPQERVYEEAALPLIEGLGSGLNATLMAYGQTSAGKTFTLGSSNPLIPKEQQGIIPRFVNALFRDIIYAKQAEADVSIRASFVELHNEDINDLLDLKLERSASEKLDVVSRRRSVNVREDPNQGVILAGIKEVEVRKPTELLRCLEKGALMRTTAATDMNAASSRSHAIFSIIIEQRMRDTGNVVTAKVRFADLAGSERVKKAGTIGERFKEGVSINQGLLALGNVISALSDAKLQRSHVPYRDSKLTRLLQDSLGGNSRTLMIACVSPAMVNAAETLNTLKYANRAKNIKNKVSVNLFAKSDDTALLREQIQKLQTELQQERRLRQRLFQEVSPQKPANANASNDVEEESPPRSLQSPVQSARRFSPRKVDRVEELEDENTRLRQELVTSKQRLKEAVEDALRCRAQLQQLRSAAGASPRPKAPSEEGNMYCEAREEEGEEEEEEDEEMKREVEENQQVQDEDEATTIRWQECLQELAEAEPLLRAPEVAGGKSRQDEDEVAEVEAQQQQEFEEKLAHEEEDFREEHRYQMERKEMEFTIEELDELIQEKVDLMDQLSRQGRAFRSMKARYELRLQELQKSVTNVSQEKEKMLKEVQQLTTQGPAASKDPQKRKAQLEGRLKEVNKQLSHLKRNEVDAQRLLKLKEQQATQIDRLQEEILKLKAQKEAVVGRMKEEDQQHKLWKRQWNDHLKELEKQHRKQGKLLQQKSAEAARSARKVEALKQNQQLLMDMAKRKAEMERDGNKTTRLREANSRLQRALRDREKRVKQLEAIVARRAFPKDLLVLNAPVPGGPVSKQSSWHHRRDARSDSSVFTGLLSDKGAPGRSQGGGRWFAAGQWPKLGSAIGWLTNRPSSRWR